MWKLFDTEELVSSESGSIRLLKGRSIMSVDYYYSQKIASLSDDIVIDDGWLSSINCQTTWSYLKSIS